MARFALRRPAWRLLVPILALLALSLATVRAQTPDPAHADPARIAEVKRLLDTPDVRALMPLLADPAVRAALAAPAAQPQPSSPRLTSLGGQLAGGLAALRTRLVALGAALPDLPAEIAAAASGLRAGADRSGLAIAIDIAAFLLGGLALQRAFWHGTAGWRRHIAHVLFDTAGARVRVTLERLLFGVLMIAAYAAGSLGAFLMFAWQPRLGSLILDALLAVLTVRAALLFGRFVFSPGAERLRLLPIETPLAWLLHRAVGAVIAEGAFGFGLLSLLDQAGMSAPGHAAFAALVWLLILLTVGVAIAIGARLRHAAHLRPRSAALTAATLVYLVVAWFAFVGGGPEYGRSMLLAVAAPFFVRGAQQMAATLIRGPAGAACTEAAAIYAVAAERMARAFAAILVALLFARIWHLDLAAFATDDSQGTRLLHGVVDAILIVLLADLLWHTLRAVIDRRLARALEQADDLITASEAQTRARTLLPILRNVLMVTLVAIAALMALSALGVQTAPLLAGAGVAGVAIGFGAQTLVRDVLSGMFFLFDDAFRVGEYVESGTVKGTVEGFSLRSVRLRHYLGQLHTVPFGNLAQITNYSRDWSSEETRVLVAHDADLDAVEEAIAETSAALVEDPLFQGVILEPLKSMGVTLVNELGFTVGLIVRTRPGKQYAVRAAALGRLKKAFAARGIRFAGAAPPALLPPEQIHPPLAAQ